MVPALEDGQRSQTGNVLGRSMALVVWRTGSSRGDGDMSKIIREFMLGSVRGVVVLYSVLTGLGTEEVKC